MKRLVQVICVVFLLCGCDGAKQHHQQQQLLEQLQTQMENQSFSIADSLPFQYDLRVSQSEEGDAYTLVIDQFEMAMYVETVVRLQRKHT